MAGPLRRRRALAWQAAEELAALEAQMESLAGQVQKILHDLEGNSRPGLLQRVPELEHSRQEAHERLSRVEASLDRAAQLQAGTQTQLAELTGRVNAHLAPDNLEHRTLALGWARNPKSLLKAGGAALVGLYLLYEAGLLHTLGEWLAGLR